MVTPEGYPLTRPIVEVVSEVRPPHPNISRDGLVCLNILNAGWRPSYTLQTVYDGLLWLFQNPNYHDPLNLAALNRSAEGGLLGRFSLFEHAVGRYRNG